MIRQSDDRSNIAVRLSTAAVSAENKDSTMRQAFYSSSQSVQQPLISVDPTNLLRRSLQEDF